MSGLGEEFPRTPRALAWHLLPAWLGLMLLLAATVAGAYWPLGRGNLVLSLVIAAAKAAIVVTVFMQLARPNPLLRLAAGAALVFLAFLFTLSFADMVTRPETDQPGTVQPRSMGQPEVGERAFR